MAEQPVHYLRTGLLILLAALLLVAGPHLAWRAQPAKPLELVLIDKTVPDTTYREHAGTVWLLNHLKYVPTGGDERFSIERDYYGFRPLDHERFEIRPLPDPLGAPDLVYIADTYGVYEAEFYEEQYDGRRSPLIYGGLTRDEVAAIEQAHRRGATLIAEFNTFASPTSGMSRAAITELLGVAWSGWIGRFVYDLKQVGEVPVWFIRNHERATGAPWPYSGPGFIFAHSDGRQFVLVDHEHTLGYGVRFEPSERLRREYGVHGAYRYAYWFDVCTPREGTEVLAHWRIEATEAGRDLLQRHGVPERFAAVFRRNGPGGAPAYYFAGDLADLRAYPEWYRFAGLARVRQWFATGIEGDPATFFWKVYVPMVRTILVETHARPD